MFQEKAVARTLALDSICIVPVHGKCRSVSIELPGLSNPGANQAHLSDSIVRTTALGLSQ